MNEKQLKLLSQRLIHDIVNCNESENLKIKRNKIFCMRFFGKETPDIGCIRNLMIEAVDSQNELEFDLILMLIEHFEITKNFDLFIAPLLVLPWHHMHDRIARILEFDACEDTVEYLAKGAIYRCDNLEYESEYCEFNRKCLYALMKIGTPEAIESVKFVSKCTNQIIADHAKRMLQ